MVTGLCESCDDTSSSSVRWCLGFMLLAILALERHANSYLSQTLNGCCHKVRLSGLDVGVPLAGCPEANSVLGRSMHRL